MRAATQSGLPINVGGPDISRIADASPSRASVVPGVQAEYPLPQSIANSRDWNNARGCTKPWFNPAAFSTTPEFQIPNGPRLLPNIREGWLRSVDANLQKSVFLNERIRLSLQLRAFNGLNQVSFGGPSIVTAGQPNSAAPVASSTTPAGRRSAPSSTSEPNYLRLSS